MNDLSNLQKLLDSGLITKDEFNIIQQRLKESDSEYQITWQNVLDEFYNWCTERYTINTSKGYRVCLYKFILHLTGEDDNEHALSCYFKTYTFKTVNNFIIKMQDNGFSSQAVSKTRYAVVVFGKFLESKGYDIPDLSKLKVSVRQDINKTTIALRHEEILEIASCGDLRAKVCIMLGYEASLKRIELQNVKAKEFIPKDGKLLVYDKFDALNRVCVLSKETIKATSEYIDELYANIDRWNKSRIAKGKPAREDYGYIFQSVKMVTPSYSALQTMLKENSKNYYMKKGFKGDELAKKVSMVTFESIRNSRKVYLLSKGLTVNNVMQICGDNNYMSTHRFEKLVPDLYPEVIPT